MSSLNAIVASRIASKLQFDAEVRVEPFDYGNFLGAAVIVQGRRHAVKLKIEDGDVTAAADLAADALNDWRANG